MTTRDVLYARARRLGFSREDSEDLTQETLIIAFRKGNFELPWLFKVLSNQIGHHLRKAKRFKTQSFEALDPEHSRF